jgi:hypothetical protein
MMARRAAVADGWRALGREIEAISIPGGRTVGFHAGQDAVVRHELEKLIRSAAVVSERTVEDESCEVVLALSIGALPDILGLRGDARLSGGPVEQWTARMETEWGLQREATLAAAKEDARRKIMMHVNALKAGPYGSVDEAMMIDPGLQQEILALVNAAHSGAARFDNRGGCEVDMQFDLAEAARLARARVQR